MGQRVDSVLVAQAMACGEGIKLAVEKLVWEGGVWIGNLDPSFHVWYKFKYVQFYKLILG